MSLLRTVRTLAPLRPSQLVWRARYAAGRWIHRRRGTPAARWAPPGSGAPPVRDDFPTLPPAWPEGDPGRTTEALAEGVFDLLGTPVELGREHPDWRLGEHSADRLWTITLHYHEWAWDLARTAGGDERAAALFRHYVGDWIARCSLDVPGTTALAWNSYAVSRRLESWIRSYVHARDALFAGHPAAEHTFLRSAWTQAAWLAGHLEWDLRANHLLRDLVGLALAGRFFAGERPRVWLERATRLALRQADEQFLTDGGHFERSAKYHLDAMADLLLLCHLVEDPAAKETLRARWMAAAEYLAWIRHPDGDAVQLNDGTRGLTGAIDRHLEAGAAAGLVTDATPRRGSRFFQASGLAVFHGDPWSVFFDVGPVGPDVQPGHGHADTLTLECSLRGERLIVDPGSHSYDHDERRAYDRATASHPTVTIDGESSSEVWHVFRLGRRARPFGAWAEEGEASWVATGGHDGYDHLPGAPRHSRRVEVGDGGSLRLLDRIAGGGEHSAAGGLLIEPSWAVEPRGDGWRLEHAGGAGAVEVRITARPAGSDAPESAVVERIAERRSYHPRYGVETEASWIGWTWRGIPPLEVETVLTPVPAEATP